MECYTLTREDYEILINYFENTEPDEDGNYKIKLTPVERLAIITAMEEVIDL